MKTRKDYMKSSCSHQEYYGQFVTDEIIQYVGRAIGVDRIKNSTDKYFNDIGLKNWDSLKIMDMVNRKKWGDEIGFICCVPEWLTSIGFDKSIHRLNVGDIKILKYVIDIFYNELSPGGHKKYLIDELFIPVSSNIGYWCQGLNYRVDTTKLLKNLISQCVFIHDVNPNNFYFELRNGSLYISYQTILGQRKLCEVK